jgi:hypothetical protein
MSNRLARANLEPDEQTALDGYLISVTNIYEQLAREFVRGFWIPAPWRSRLVVCYGFRTIERVGRSTGRTSAPRLLKTSRSVTFLAKIRLAHSVGGRLYAVRG